MTTINQSFNKTDRTPYIELEKIGNRIYIDFDYGLSEGSNDLYDGEVTYSLGKTEKNDKIENEFDSELNLNFYHVISPGKAITGKYELDDFNSGTSITFDFKMISYDEKAKYNGSSGVDIVFGSNYVDKISGSAGNDYLAGGAGNDSINGGSGADMISGGKGNDILIGGAGDDRFFFYNTPGITKDTIKDFDNAHETIWLDDAEFTALHANDTTPVKLNKDLFSANTLGAARDADDRIIYETDTGKLYYDADGFGNNKAVQFATIDSGLRINAGDFFVF